MTKTSKKYFNLVEVTISLGIAIVALAVMTSMLPVGLKHSRNAISSDLVTSIINSFADHIVESNSFSTMNNFSKADAHPSTEPTGDDYSTTQDAALNTLFNNKVYPHSSNDQLFRLVSRIPGSNLNEVDAEIRVWTDRSVLYSDGKDGDDDRSLGFSSRREGKTAEVLIHSDMTTLFVEFSWPLTDNYEDRQKLIVIRDITES